jgi:hypothetical protein
MLAVSQSVSVDDGDIVFSDQNRAQKTKRDETLDAVSLK